MPTSTPPTTHRRSFAGLLIAIAVIALCGAVDVPATTAQTTDSGPAIPTNSVTVIGAQPDVVARLGWALDRYQAAELELPDLVVRFHDTNAGCGGGRGLRPGAPEGA